MIMLSTILFAVLILVITSNSFLYGMWGLGVSMFFVSFMVFGNIGVEVFNDVAWNSGLSIWLIIMSLWVGGISYLCSSYQSVKRSVVFSVSVLCLVIICILVFVVSSWFLFFFFFESSLVPIIFLILGWGYQPERLQASFYLLLYTVCVSLPMLLVLLYMCVLVGGNSFYYVCDWESNSFTFMILLLAPFFVKSPMFLVHLWLPKAHVEAPVSGSMMLAGVLLKFGGYGMIMVFYWFSFSVNCLFLFVICFCLWGGLLSGLICIRQVDVKSLIAYSSVGHMSLCLSGVMSCMGLGWLGGLLMMLGHGLCSSGLFGLAGYAYKVCSSRALVLCSGFLVFMPSMSICWFLLCSSNMSFPPSLGLLSEIFLMVALVGFSLWLMIPLGLMVFVVGVYSLILYGYSQHGSECGLSFGGKLLGFDYMLMTFLLWVPLNLLSVCSDLLIGWV